ncbi:MAG: FkbM family methyltransferase [Bacteroidota bacterium]
MTEVRLPNGLDIVCQSPTEALFFYEDLFEKQVYFRNGITLPEDACVFDVGSNIGMFMLSVHFLCVRPRLFCFEPAPPLYRILDENRRRHGVDATLHNFGISDEETTASFTFYPQSSGMSSFHGDLDEERQVLRSLMENQRDHGMPGMEAVMKHADDLLEARLQSTALTCQLRRLSDVIAEHGISTIDLLKIDVQKCEMEVLHGLSEEDWPKIKQIVVEVHDTEGRVEAMNALLHEHGYRVLAEQDTLYEGTGIYNLYAHRPLSSSASAATAAAARLARRKARNRTHQRRPHS